MRAFKLFLILNGLYTRPVMADALPACKLALQACQDVVVTQDEANKHLKQAVADLTARLEAQDAPRLPVWLWVAVGVAVGATGASLLAR